MEHFIDMHCHILPGVDDGSESIEMSEKMLEIAIEQGIDTIVATPHYIPGVGYFKLQNRIDAYHRLNEYIREKELPIKLLMGNEIYLDELMIEKIKNKECLPVGNTRYVILEFPMSNEPRNLSYLISCLQEEGYYPIIAHPERYAWLIDEPETLDSLITQGCLMQINTGSVTDLYGKTIMKAVKKMFIEDKVHLVGTDAHTDRKRAPMMREAYETVKQWIGQAYADLIFYKNPDRVLKNIPPESILNEMKKCSSERKCREENSMGFISSFVMKLHAKKL